MWQMRIDVLVPEIEVSPVESVEDQEQNWCKNKEEPGVTKI